jgi:hypothetical protein
MSLQLGKAEILFSKQPYSVHVENETPLAASKRIVILVLKRIGSLLPFQTGTHATSTKHLHSFISGVSYNYASNS